MDLNDIRATHWAVEEGGERWTERRCGNCGELWEPLRLGASTVYGCSMLRNAELAAYEAGISPRALITPKPVQR